MINQFQVFPVLSVPRMIHLTHFCFLSKSLSNSLKSRLFSRMKVVSAELSVSPVKSDYLKTPFGLLFRCIFHKQAVIFFYLVLLYI